MSDGPGSNPSAAGEDLAVLAARARAGSANAAEALVRLSWPGAHRTAYLIVQDRGAAEDIAQESLLAAISSLDRFNARRRFEPWLHRIVANRSIDWLRAQQGKQAMDFAEMERVVAPANLEVGLGADAVAALRALDPEDRAIVVLRHVFDYTSREIARALGMPARTVRTRLRRALALLRADLEKEGEEGALLSSVGGRYAIYLVRSEDERLTYAIHLAPRESDERDMLISVDAVNGDLIAATRLRYAH